MHRVTNSARKLHIRFRITWKHDIAIGYGDGHGAWALKTGYALTVHHPLRNRKTYSCFLISMPELMGYEVQLPFVSSPQCAQCAVGSILMLWENGFSGSWHSLDYDAQSDRRMTNTG